MEYQAAPGYKTQVCSLKEKSYYLKRLGIKRLLVKRVSCKPLSVRFKVKNACSGDLVIFWCL